MKIIDKGIKDELSPEAIDLLVHVNDSYALRSLKSLDQNIIRRIEKQSLTFSLLLKEVSRQSKTEAAFVIVSTLFIALFIFLIFNKVVITPVKKMSDLMLEMASGNLDSFVDDSDDSGGFGKTELGKMKTALSIFKKNEISRRVALIEIQKLALTDSLTALANRHQFEKKYQEMSSSAHHEEQGLTILALDLDDFKVINDDYGHGAGDIILQSVAKKLRQVLRSTDLIARLGGDEFAVIMPGDIELCDVISTVKRLLAVIPLPVAYGKDSLTVGMSVGIVQRSTDANDALGVLMKQADQALYESKRKGKNTYSVYSKS